MIKFTFLKWLSKTIPIKQKLNDLLEARVGALSRSDEFYYFVLTRSGRLIPYSINADNSLSTSLALE